MRAIAVAPFLFVLVLFFLVVSPVIADTVKVTPLGSHQGKQASDPGFLRYY